MSFFKWLAAGLVGAAIGGVAWVLIGYFANYEVGWIAWGIGLLAGMGVRVAAGDSAHGAAPGIAAVAAAATGVAASKYIVVWLLVNQMAGQAAVNTPDFQSEELAIQRTADEIIETDYLAAGKQVPWPGGMNQENADSEAEYPPAIWAKAKEKWAALPEAEKQAKRDEWKQQYEEITGAFAEAMRSAAFEESFTPWDLLWFGLAMFTAFRVGSGLNQE